MAGRDFTILVEEKVEGTHCIYHLQQGWWCEESACGDQQDSIEHVVAYWSCCDGSFPGCSWWKVITMLDIENLNIVCANIIIAPDSILLYFLQLLNSNLRGIMVLVSPHFSFKSYTGYLVSTIQENFQSDIFIRHSKVFHHWTEKIEMCPSTFSLANELPGDKFNKSETTSDWDFWPPSLSLKLCAQHSHCHISREAISSQ